MQSELERVLELQSAYDRRNTHEMQERGQLIRKRTAVWLGTHTITLAQDIGLAAGDFFSEGGDGSGWKSRVPWIRFGSRAWTPSATEGFYVVYLFDAFGRTVYLSLNQGTTRLVKDYGRHRATELLLERVSWARVVLGDWLAEHTHTPSIALHDRGLGDDYEHGNIASIAYARGAVPDDVALLADARIYAAALGRLYASQGLEPLAGESPEVEHVAAAAEEGSGRSGRSRGAGFRISATDIKLVETHAVGMARTHYEEDGWKVREYGKPFDLEVRRGSERLTVEVKGTTSDGASVQLTDGEVRHHAKAYPNNALVIVRRIRLDRTAPATRASGGELHEYRGWSIVKSDLRPISYRYTVPPAIYMRKGLPIRVKKGLPIRAF